MWATGIYSYGLTEQQFWSLTPAQFHALGKLYEIEREAEDYGFGTIASLIYNANRSVKKDPNGKTWTHWYPQWKTKEQESRKKTPEELKQYFEMNVMPFFNSKKKMIKKVE